MADESTETDSRGQRVDDAIAAYLAALDAGGAPSRRDWVARHPDLAPDLERFFDDDEGAGAVVGPLRSAAGAEASRPATATCGAAAAALPSTVACGDGESRGPAPRPSRFGGFNLIERLGEGGQGVVYKARQRSPNRLVALKTLRAGLLASADEVRRFRDEADAIADLEHRHIVPVYEVGEHQGCLFFSMKLMEGGSLSRNLARFHDDPRSAARLVVSVAGAVGYAHRRGLLHRDLKPWNILFDAEGEPHVTDFGLAKRVGQDVDQTLSGVVLGTPPYMAPEQADGRRGAVTTATDVYGLGAILYTMLVGRAPFRGDSTWEILEKVKADEPEPPSGGNRRVDRDLETICMTCLRKDPQKRYASAEALADDLGRWLRREPIWSRRTSTRERVVMWARRRPAIAALLASLVLITLLGFAGVGWQWRRTERARRELDSTAYFALVAAAEREWAAGNVGRSDELLRRCPPHLRGWEWTHLVGLRQGAPRVLRPGGIVYGAAFRADGRTIATGGSDKVIRLWDAEKGVESLPRLKGAGHGDTVRCLAFSTLAPDLLASASWDKSVKVWNTRTRELVLDLPGHTKYVIGVAFDPKRPRLVSASADKTLKVWDLTRGARLRTLDGHRSAVLCVAFNPDGSRFVSAGDDGVLILWDAETLKQVWDIPTHTDTVRSVAFSPDGRRVASAGGDGTVKVWDVRDGSMIDSPRGGHSDVIHSVAFGTDSGADRCASAGGDGTVKVWDARTWDEALTLRGHEDVVRVVAFSPDGRRLVSAGDDGTVRLWDAPRLRKDRDPVVTIGPLDTVPWQATFDPTGRRVAAAGGDGSVYMWDATTGRPVRNFRAHEERVWSLAFSPDGSRLATASSDQTVRVWGVDSTDHPLSLAGHGQDVLGVAFSPDGRTIATVGGDGSLRIWDAQTGGATDEADAHAGNSYGVAYRRNGGGRLVTCGLDGLIKVWDSGGGRLRLFQTLRGHGGAVYGATFSPDGRRVASASTDKTVRVWDAETGLELCRSRRYAERFDVAAFSPDGRYVAGAGGDRTVRVLDSSDLREVAVLIGHTSRVLSAAFDHQGGTRLVTCGLDKTVRVWDAASWTTAPAK